MAYSDEIDGFETQINKLITLSNKRAKPLNLIEDARQLHENLKILEPNDSDDSDDIRRKNELRDEKIRNAKPYRITYQKLKKKIRARDGNVKVSSK